ncbi:MAG: Homoserine dehydrogenase [Alphaproteobacteria bacterium MarineAlpha9_Bin6]|nr:MAG: Homoserine dehydrogenase [Alphaproteobacteria bacterium MarineAlpha9_Bin6]
MTELRVGVAGLGTVGGGLVKLLATQRSVIEERCGLSVLVTAVSAKDRSRERGFDLGAAVWHDDAVSLAKDENVDVVCELIGGIGGVALEVCEAAIHESKHVVTANKAMMAVHGARLATLSEDKGVGIHYEAAVAGGIPIIKAIREGLSGNSVSGVVGILNGTCNYILTNMHDAALAGESRDFETVLEEAQKLGYAEADPSMDIDGVDAAHKLAILTSVAFGSVIDFDSIHVEGIRHISAVDIEYAIELGYRVKLLAIARKGMEGIQQRVHPCMVAERATIAHVDGVNNAIVVQSDFAGTTIYEGPGAGESATASAVASDLVDIARQHRTPTFSVPTTQLEKRSSAPMEQISGPYYIRLMLVDKPGVIADIAACLRDQNVSVESMIQRSRNPGDAVPVVLTTHEAQEISLQRALHSIDALQSVLETPRMIRIEEI